MSKFILSATQVTLSHSSEYKINMWRDVYFSVVHIWTRRLRYFRWNRSRYTLHHTFVLVYPQYIGTILAPSHTQFCPRSQLLFAYMEKNIHYYIYNIHIYVRCFDNLYVGAVYTYVHVRCQIKSNENKIEGKYWLIFTFFMIVSTSHLYEFYWVFFLF